MSLDLSFFVSSILSAYWNGAATYYRGLAKALEARGHRLRFFEPDAFDRQRHRDLEALPWAEVSVYSPDDWTEVRQCLQAASRSDFVIKASGVGVGDERLEAEVAALPVRSVFLDVDSPATLARLESNPDDPLTPLLERFEMVLCYGGGEPVRERYVALGARRCEIVYNALDPTTHHPVPPDPRFAADLAFLGNRLPDRERRVEQFFFGPARRLPRHAFLIGGSGWSDALAELPNVRSVGHVYTTDHNAFNATPTAVINISRDAMAGVGFAPATRVFEAAGAGACLITDAWPGIELFLEPGEEVLVAEASDDVVAWLEDLDPPRARRIGERARSRIAAHHTYANRAAQLEQLLAG